MNKFVKQTRGITTAEVSLLATFKHQKGEGFTFTMSHIYANGFDKNLWFKTHSQSKLEELQNTLKPGKVYRLKIRMSVVSFAASVYGPEILTAEEVDSSDLPENWHSGIQIDAEEITPIKTTDSRIVVLKVKTDSGEFYVRATNKRAEASIETKHCCLWLDRVFNKTTTSFYGGSFSFDYKNNVYETGKIVNSETDEDVEGFISVLTL